MIAIEYKKKKYISANHISVIRVKKKKQKTSISDEPHIAYEQNVNYLVEMLYVAMNGKYMLHLVAIWLLLPARIIDAYFIRIYAFGGTIKSRART